MKYLIILGNGFSLDLLIHLEKQDDIPLTNLFSHGDKLTWPASGKNAFISFRNTPNLWILGVRPNNKSEKNNQIIENVITCANAYFLKAPKSRSFGFSDKRSIYIAAYRELVVFLKYLFISFDNDISFEKKDIQSWCWAKLFINLHENPEVEKIDIITFNYDLWLERSLDILGIPYHISVITNSNDGKISVTKPHGSISFIHKHHLDSSAFSINYESDYLEGKAEDFSISMSNLSLNTAIIPLIPPAGDSGRLKAGWAGDLRTDAIKRAESLNEKDKVILCGLSYWHVDRKEIDDLLLNVPDNVDLAYINPSPPESFDAVLTSLFKHYEHYTSIKRYIGGI